MNETTLIVVVIILAIILGVIAYNMHQENQYRHKVRKQLFGHNSQDALMHSKTNSVRNGKSQEQTGILNPNTAKQKTADTPDEPVIEAEPQADDSFLFKKTVSPTLSQTQLQDKHNLLLDFNHLTKLDLPWFDRRFDYIAYISLREPQELNTVPRLSGRRFQIAGCTADGRFQIAEPIPNVYYQGFVVGLQGVSRNGLITVQELAQFNAQINQFAERINGGLLLTDTDAFLNIARPLDDLCARVDQIITLHLVSRSSISGDTLRNGLEKAGFELGIDGIFHFHDKQRQPLFSIITLDSTPFTGGLLAGQSYRGFSMLFDIPHVPAGAKLFNQFIDLAITFSSSLRLDLVNDKLEELSTQWLKEISNYVLDRQKEMQQVDIEPGSNLAKRLFS